MFTWKTGVVGAPLIGAVLLALSGSAAMAADAVFDKPVKTVHLPLPRDPDNPQAKAELTCAYYKDFMVKQVDLGEEGADQLSIVPRTASSDPVCQRKNAPNEKVVAADDWSGYFNGVKGNYVFFDGDDGWNDGMGFAVFTPDAKKVLDDAEKKWHSLDVTPGSIAIRYERVYAPKCSLYSGTTCWQQIKRDTGLTDAMPPDCRAAYTSEQKRTPKLAQEVLTDPTVIDYEAVATIDAHGHKIVPATGRALRCRPAE